MAPKAKAIPNKGPPKAKLQNRVTQSPAEISVPLAISRKIVKNTIATPSLKRDSISIRVSICKGAPNSFNKATTATGSVVDKIEQRVAAIPQDNSL